MTPLALAGSAIAVAGATPSERRMVLRVRDPRSAAEIDDRDGALIRDEGDLLPARARGFKTAVFLERASDPDNADGFGVTVRLGERFEHLGDGDIVGIDPGSLRLRVLYRRASKHNSFLVTERCNHYCLMCSQPPRNVKDGWIIDEIASCIDLVDQATETVGFTGGEPLLEWRRFIALLAVVRGRLPETAIHVLTNGRAFAAEEVTAAWAALRTNGLQLGSRFTAPLTPCTTTWFRRPAPSMIRCSEFSDSRTRGSASRCALCFMPSPHQDCGRPALGWREICPLWTTSRLWAWKTRASPLPTRLCCGSTRSIIKLIWCAALRHCVLRV